MDKTASRIAAGLAFAASLLALSPAIAAEGVEDYYKGRTITLAIGYSVGGGYDLYARLVAAYLGRHIPGNPDSGAAEHARRRQPQGRELHLFGRAQGRLGHRPFRSLHGIGAAPWHRRRL